MASSSCHCCQAYIPVKHKNCSLPVIKNVDPHSKLEYGCLLSANATTFFLLYSVDLGSY